MSKETSPGKKARLGWWDTEHTQLASSWFGAALHTLLVASVTRQDLSSLWLPVFVPEYCCIWIFALWFSSKRVWRYNSWASFVLCDICPFPDYNTSLTCQNLSGREGSDLTWPWLPGWSGTSSVAKEGACKACLLVPCSWARGLRQVSPRWEVCSLLWVGTLPYSSADTKSFSGEGELGHNIEIFKVKKQYSIIFFFLTGYY